MVPSMTAELLVTESREQLDIIYQDDALVVVNKPSGLLVHRSMIDRHETRFAMQIVRDQVGRHVFPLHRLDKPTSGVLVFALSSELAKKAGEQFQQDTIYKRYRAVVRGYAPESIVIDYALKEELDKIVDKKARKDKPAQEAVTALTRLATVELPVMIDRYPQSRYSLVELTPKTGRKHQIRRHMKHIAHPVIGDAKHGKGVHNRYFGKYFQASRLLLHCSEMGMIHPVSSEPLVFKAAMDDTFRQLFQRFGWDEFIESQGHPS